MLRRAYLHYLCVFLLLVAQQSALAHAVWHTLDGSRFSASVDHEFYGEETGRQGNSENLPKKAGLCAFDIAFGQVLGGTHSVRTPITLIRAAAERIPGRVAAQRRFEALTPRSRGPPVLP